MQIHPTIASLRSALAAERFAGKRIGFAPTMGNLHAGHASLMTEARQHADCVVASIFVNRLQFGPAEDFDRYPRTFTADCDTLQGAGVDHLFAPTEAELYPAPQSYFIEPETFQQTTLEGEFRPGHFRGVATVVMKLFNIAQPDVALFGKKDFQQLMVISNMVRDLNLPIEIIGVPTVRAEDGLALSSRNGYLSAEERREAPRLYRALKNIVSRLREGAIDLRELEAKAVSELEENGWKPQYVAVRKTLDLREPGVIKCASADGSAARPEGLVVLGAAWLGQTRLIDNIEV